MAGPQREWDPSGWIGSHTPWGPTWSLLSPGPPSPHSSAAKGPFLLGSSTWLAGQRLCRGVCCGGVSGPCQAQFSHVDAQGTGVPTWFLWVVISCPGERIHSEPVILKVCSGDPAGDPQVKTVFMTAQRCVRCVLPMEAGRCVPVFDTVVGFKFRCRRRLM